MTPIGDTGSAGPLTPTEKTEFDKLREVVRKGISTFVAVGKALKQIKQKQLHRETHETFEDFVQAEWAMGKAYAYRQIAAAEVTGVLADIGVEPVSEAQVRPLTKLKPELAVACWERAIEQSGKGADGQAKVTAESVKAAVEALSPKRTVKRKKGKKPRVVTFRLPGGKVVVTPTKVDGDVAQLLAAALKEAMPREKLKQAA